MSGGTIKSGNLQVGQDGTASNNFTWYQPAVADGTVRLGVGVAGATTSDIMTVNSSGVTINGVISQSAKGSTSNTAFGTQALNANTTGTNNVAIGYQTLYTNTVGTDNASLGWQSGYNTTGSANCYFGSQAGVGISSGNANIAIGNYALGGGPSTANDNIAIGGGVLYANTSGAQNTAIGGGSYAAAYPTMRFNTSGSYNTALGNQALTNNTTANGNTAIGYQALNANTTGNKNVGVGYQAGNTVTTGVGNTYIGYGAVASGTGVLSEMVICATGGTTGRGNNTGILSVSSGGGSFYNGGNTSTWQTTSDQRLKKNIVDNNTGLDVISQIKVRNFEYRLPEEVDEALKPTDAILKEGIQLGVIAQELQQVLPDCVKEESTGVLSVCTDNLTWYLVNAIQELKAEIDALKGAK